PARSARVHQALERLRRDTGRPCGDAAGLRLVQVAPAGNVSDQRRDSRCARHDSNMRPLPPQGSALSPELRALADGTVYPRSLATKQSCDQARRARLRLPPLVVAREPAVAASRFRALGVRVPPP